MHRLRLPYLLPLGRFPRPLMPAVLLLLLLLLAAVPVRFDIRAASQPREESATPVAFTNASDIRHLTKEQSAIPTPATLRGVVTYCDPAWQILFVRDTTGGIFISLAAGTHAPTNSELIEVNGKVGPGSFLPVVAGATWRHLGTGSLPPPARVGPPDVFAGDIDAEWSEWVGTVRHVALTADGSHVQVDVMQQGWRARIFFLLPPGSDAKAAEASLQALLDAQVSIVGVAGIDYELGKGVTGLKGFVPSLANLRVIDPPPADPFGLPVVTLAHIRGLTGTNVPVHRILTRGSVTGYGGPGELFLQDAESAVRLQTADTNRFQLGDSLEVAGFVSSGLFSPVLGDALVKPSSIRVEAESMTVSPAKLLWGDYDGNLVRVQGTVQSSSFAGTNHVLTLLAEGVVFGVTLSTTNAAPEWEGFSTGDPVRVTGVCVIQGLQRNAPQSFQILVRQASDVERLTRGPTVTARQAMVAAALAAALCAIVLGWGMTLRRRVREQTAIIQARMDKEIALERRYRELLEKASFPVLVFERESLAVRYVNRRAKAQLHGDEPPKTGSLVSVHFDVPEALQSLLGELAKAGHVTDLEARLRTGDGEPFWALVSANSIEFDGANAVLLAFSDISEHKRMEDALREAHKMEGIGQLAGGVAHEFNNILAAMMLSLSLVRANPGDPEADRTLEELEDLSRRAADLVRQLLAFSRKSPMQAATVDLPALVTSFAGMLQRLMGSDIALDLACAESLPAVIADPGMVKQVLMNLCLNARDAMVGGGTMRIQLKQAEVDDKRANAHPGAVAGKFVSLSISDTGAGMDETTRKRLFEPFFTTKGVGKGTGLGLATVYGIVTQHHGLIEVESAIGRGTTFTIYFPASAEPTEPKPAPAPAPDYPKGNETILLVEDEPALRRTTSRILQHVGYHVIEAGDAEEASALWRAHRTEIRLLFTDMAMPGTMNGLALSQQLRRDQPHLKVIIASGYNTETSQALDTDGVATVYLAKPFTHDALMSVVRGCLDA